MPALALRVAALAALLGAVACGSEPAPAPPAPIVSWGALRNPLLGYPDAAIKDAFLVRHEGIFRLGYSLIRDDPFRFRLGFASSTDLVTFQPAPTLDQPETGGLASPTVVRAPDGRFVMTYNSHTRDVGTALNKLYLRTSSDLQVWSEPTRLHIDGADADDDRLIDAALAFTDHGAFLLFKREQRPQIAHSPSGAPEGPWKLLGAIEPDNLENLQALRIDGRWHLLGTSLPLVHRPMLYRLDGDEADPAAWRSWTPVRELEIPEQSWNRGPTIAYERANAAYLVDARPTDGFFYLLYAGSTEVKSFEGRGHASLGLARSPDLITWDVPPER